MPKLDQLVAQEKRQHIVNCAKAVFSEKGYAESSIKDITRKAGISNGALFIYFDRKKDILIELINQNMGMLQERIETLALQEENLGLQETIELLLELIRQVSLTYGGVLFLDVWAAALHDQEIKQVMEQNREKIFKSIEIMIVKVSGNKVETNLSLRRTRIGFYSLIPGYIIHLVMIGPIEPKAYLSAQRLVLSTQ